MDKITEVIRCLFILPYEVYFALLAVLCAIYLLLIGPALYKFWIIPRMKNQYRTNFKSEVVPYHYNFVFFANWQMPSLEISSYMVLQYILLKFFNRQIRGVKKTLEGSFWYRLKEINYEITNASKTEIVIGFITVFNIFCLILACAVACIHGKY